MPISWGNITAAANRSPRDLKREMITIYNNDQTPTCGQTGPNEPSLDTTSLTSHLVLHCGRTWSKTTWWELFVGGRKWPELQDRKHPKALASSEMQRNAKKI
jgi:hypothetical protein